jgi:hypothetical protein
MDDDELGPEDEAPEGTNAVTLRTSLAAMEVAEVMGGGGLTDLKVLTSGGKEHLIDPRLINARRVRLGCAPSLNTFASARGLATIVADAHARLQTSHPGLVATRTAGAAHWTPCTGVDVRPGHVVAPASAVEACASYGFRPVCFTGRRAGPGPSGAPRVDGFCVAGLGGSMVLCDASQDLVVAITLSKLVPRRAPALAILHAVADALRLGTPILA